MSIIRFSIQCEINLQLSVLWISAYNVADPEPSDFNFEQTNNFVRNCEVLCPVKNIPIKLRGMPSAKPPGNSREKNV